MGIKEIMNFELIAQDMPGASGGHWFLSWIYGVTQALPRLMHGATSTPR